MGNQSLTQRPHHGDDDRQEHDGDERGAHQRGGSRRLG